MNKQKAVRVDGLDVSDLNDHLSKGWEVLFVTAQVVSTGSDLASKGGFLVILEKKGVE